MTNQECSTCPMTNTSPAIRRNHIGSGISLLRISSRTTTSRKNAHDTVSLRICVSTANKGSKTNWHLQTQGSSLPSYDQMMRWLRWKHCWWNGWWSIHAWCWTRQPDASAWYNIWTTIWCALFWAFVERWSYYRASAQCVYNLYFKSSA